jgi:hypothetical protein
MKAQELKSKLKSRLNRYAVKLPTLRSIMPPALMPGPLSPRSPRRRLNRSLSMASSHPTVRALDFQRQWMDVNACLHHRLSFWDLQQGLRALRLRPPAIFTGGVRTWSSFGRTLGFPRFVFCHSKGDETSHLNLVETSHLNLVASASPCARERHAREETCEKSRDVSSTSSFVH